MTLPAGGRARIIIVEDNLSDVVLVEEALHAHGIDFDMTHLSDGAEALSALKSYDPSRLKIDLILLDLNIPKVAGIEVLKAVRGNVVFKDVPVIILTSSPAPEEQLAARALGITNYVRKPFGLKEFIDEVGMAIRESI